VRTVRWFLKVRKLSVDFSNPPPDSLLSSPQLPSLQHLHQIYKQKKSSEITYYDNSNSIWNFLSVTEHGNRKYFAIMWMIPGGTVGEMKQGTNHHHFKRIRIQIQLFTSTRIQIRIQGDKPCGSMRMQIRILVRHQSHQKLHFF
jgi:hypothetical protein